MSWHEDRLTNYDNLTLFFFFFTMQHAALGSPHTIFFLALGKETTAGLTSYPNARHISVSFCSF
jgi:hypothetical protein